MQIGILKSAPYPSVPSVRTLVVCVPSVRQRVVGNCAREFSRETDGSGVFAEGDGVSKAIGCKAIGCKAIR